MARLKRLYMGGRLLDVPHPFEEELEYLVSAGHRLVMERVSRSEEEGIAKAENEDLPELQAYFEEVRKAANNLALVGLVTRLHHWLSLFVEELTNESARDKSLMKNLRGLNHRIGEGPIPDDFFRDLVTVRDSIIHADNKVKWEFAGDTRQVADRYANLSLGEIEFTTDHLKEAIAKSIEQVKWYDAKI
jgi:hypothetical protein